MVKVTHSRMIKTWSIRLTAYTWQSSEVYVGLVNGFVKNGLQTEETRSHA